MFTGIIEEVNTIQRIVPLGNGSRLTMHGTVILDEIALGDSIAINGVCLTVVQFDASSFTVEAVEETMRKSSLSGLRTGSKVNMERAMRAGGKLGGHFVQGHVDCTGTLRNIERRQESWIFWFTYPKEYDVNLIPVGSITIDGVSLTVSEKRDGLFAVSVIPHTYESTLFHTYSEGTIVNLELDMIGKYVLNFLRAREGGDSLTNDVLLDMGY